MKSVHPAKYYVSQGLQKIVALNIENKKLSLRKLSQNDKRTMDKILLGAIAGDVIGSYYEFIPARTTDFPLFNDNSTHFTDDTQMPTGC